MITFRSEFDAVAHLWGVWVSVPVMQVVKRGKIQMKCVSGTGWRRGRQKHGGEGKQPLTLPGITLDVTENLVQ